MSDPFEEPSERNNLLLNSIENLIERQLKASTAARVCTNKLSGKTLALELTGIGLNVYVKCHEESVQLSTHYEEDADVIITGSPLAMLAFAQSSEHDALRGGGVKFAGDIGVAQEFQKLFGLLSPDFEEELSRLIGDEAAYRVGSTVRSLFAFGKTAFDNLAHNVGDYLVQSPSGTVANEELEQFLEDVDRIRADVDRVEVKFDRLVSATNKG